MKKRITFTWDAVVDMPDCFNETIKDSLGYQYALKTAWEAVQMESGKVLNAVLVLDNEKPASSLLRVHSQFFPDSQVTTISQSGKVLVDHGKGLTVDLWAQACEKPHLAELGHSDGDDCDHVGLEFDGDTLVGYDGCFELPKEVIITVKAAGYKVSEDLE